MARVLAAVAVALVACFALFSVKTRHPNPDDRWYDTSGLAPIEAAPSSSINVLKLPNSADLVAIGEISETIVVPWHQLHAWLRVDRLIKGAMPQNAVEDLCPMPWQSRRRGRSPPHYGLFFTMGSPGEYRAVSCLRPSLAVRPAPVPDLPAHGEPLAIISAALAQLLTAPAGAA